MKPCLYLFVFLLFFSESLSRAEIYQLETVKRVEEATLLEKVSPDQLVEKELAKEFVIVFLKAPVVNKFQMTTNDFKKKRNQDFLENIFNKESYDKIDFQEVKLHNQKSAEHVSVKVNIYWFSEGYEGVQTFYFELIKVKDRWVLDWLVY